MSLGVMYKMTHSAESLGTLRLILVSFGYHRIIAVMVMNILKLAPGSGFGIRIQN
jgi:hypothetical protein